MRWGSDWGSQRYPMSSRTDPMTWVPRQKMVSWGSEISGLDTPGPLLVYRANRQIWEGRIWSGASLWDAGKQENR